MATIIRNTKSLWRLTAILLALVLVLGPAAAVGHAASPAVLPSEASDLKIAWPQSDSWRGEYYNNIHLSGAPLVRNDARIDFNWGAGSPMAGINADYFGVRWTRQITLEAKTYRFYVRADDGVRLWVDGQLLIDQWHDSSAATYSVERAMTAGVHTFRVEMYERAGDAVAKFWREEVAGSSAWKGEYYNNINLSGAPRVRNDARIDFNWGTGSPMAGINADYFSVRWTRQITLEAKTYRFYVRADDGVRLWVDGQLLIDQWHDSSATTYSVDRAMTAGVHTFRVEMYERAGDAVARFWREEVAGSSAWRGEYYNNKNLSGTPVVVRNDPAIDFVWGVKAPAAGLPVDNFSVRWTRTLYFSGGATQFTVDIDDGVRLWVDNQLIIDHWHDAVATYIGQVWLSPGNHTVRMEMFEHTGGAMARLRWSNTLTFPDWKGQYFANRDLSGSPALVRNDPAIDFDWGAGAPAAGLPADHFSVRWTRSLDFTQGTYRFFVNADDGVRLWVAGHLIIDQWRDGLHAYTGDITLPKGRHEVRMELYERTGNAVAQLWWTQNDGAPAWSARYFDNPDLDGAPVVIRNVADINFDWGTSAPVAGVPANHFGVKFVRKATFAEGTYRFCAKVDDAVSVEMDDRLPYILREWHNGPGSYCQDFYVKGGYHKLTVEFYDYVGPARIRFWMNRLTD